MIEDYYSREQSGCDTEGDKIARGKLHLLHACSALAARVAAALHGHRQLVRPAEGADEQRHQNRNQCLCPVNQATRLKVGASGLLCGDDLVRLLDQRGDKAKCNAHHHGELMHRHFYLFERSQHDLQRIRQRNGRGGIGEQEGTCHQHQNADNHKRKE